jgi:hypothetical protein
VQIVLPAELVQLVQTKHKQPMHADGFASGIATRTMLIKCKP